MDRDEPPADPDAVVIVDDGPHRIAFIDVGGNAGKLARIHALLAMLEHEARAAVGIELIEDMGLHGVAVARDGDRVRLEDFYAAPEERRRVIQLKEEPGDVTPFVRIRRQDNGHPRSARPQKGGRRGR
ncbi:hypothetical protein [Sphingobium yanoikuyae]|uniref:hypothetical protein n=1 Tax=Sphingobium yanoikuyae TaxID=13690 RepID=UPI0035C732DE